MYIRLREDDGAIVLRQTEGGGVKEELIIPHEEDDDAPMEEAHYCIAFYGWGMQQPRLREEFSGHMEEEQD